MNDKKLVVFDMDGLLFNTEEIGYEAMRLAFKNMGEEFPVERYIELIGMREDDTNRALQQFYGEKFPIDTMLVKYKNAFKSILDNDQLKPKRGAIELLNFLDENNFKKCIASSSDLSAIEKYLKLTNLTDRFDFYVSGEEVANGKPAPDIFIEACKRANELPENAIVLEDSLNGLRSAKAANIDCIVIPDMVPQNEEIVADATYILPTLKQVIDILQ